MNKKAHEAVIIGYIIEQRVDSNHIDKKNVVAVYILLPLSLSNIYFYFGINSTLPIDKLIN